MTATNNDAPKTGDFAFAGNVHRFEARLLEMYQDGLEEIAARIDRMLPDGGLVLVLYDTRLGDDLSHLDFVIRHLEFIVVEFDLLLSKPIPIPDDEPPPPDPDAERELKEILGRALAVPSALKGITAIHDALPAITGVARFAADLVRPNVDVKKLTTDKFRVVISAGPLYRAFEATFRTDVRIIDPALHFPRTDPDPKRSRLFGRYEEVVQKMLKASSRLTDNAAELKGTPLKAELEALLERSAETIRVLTEAKDGQEAVLHRLMRVEPIERAIADGAYSVYLNIEAGGANLWTSRYLFLPTEAWAELSVAINYAVLDPNGETVDGGVQVVSEKEAIALMPKFYSQILRATTLLIGGSVLIWLWMLIVSALEPAQ